MAFLYPIVMNLEELPFKIGMQYEHWEFDLEPVEFAKQYDKYKYIKNDIPIVLDIEVKHIYLYFNWDILYKVEIIFSTVKPLGIFTVLKGMLEVTFGEQHIRTEEYLNDIYVIWELEQMKLKLVYNFDLNSVSLEIN